MPLNPSGAISLAGPVAGQSIAVELGQSATATISLNDTNVRTLAQVPSGVIVMPTNFWGKSSGVPGLQRGIFAFGSTPVAPLGVTIMNLVSNTGVVATDTPSAGPGRWGLGASSYGIDKAIFGFGVIPPAMSSEINLVSNTGVMASSTPVSISDLRISYGAASYGTDKAIFIGGQNPSITPTNAAYRSTANLISNTGVVASDSSGFSSSRTRTTGVPYGGNKAIFAWGRGVPATPSASSLAAGRVFNLVSDTGVVASNVSTAGVARENSGATGYGGDKAIFAYASVYVYNLVSNTGVIASDTPGVGSNRNTTAGLVYGGDKGIFGWGSTVSVTNLVSNTGVIASDTPGVATTRSNYAGASYSYLA